MLSILSSWPEACYSDRENIPDERGTAKSRSYAVFIRFPVSTRTHWGAKDRAFASLPAWNPPTYVTYRRGGSPHHG